MTTKSLLTKVLPLAGVLAMNVYPAIAHSQSDFTPESCFDIQDSVLSGIS